MLLYLDIAWERWRASGRMESVTDLADAVEHGAVKRIRPKTMAVVTTFLALVPILWATGTGADVMKRIAAPMVGGLLTSFVGELAVFPAIYFIWRSIGLRRGPLFPVGRSADLPPAFDPAADLLFESAEGASGLSDSAGTNPRPDRTDETTDGGNQA